MSTKIVAAQLATAAGVTTVITRSSNPGNVLNIVRYLQAKKAPAASIPTPTPTSTSIASSSAALETPPSLPGGGVDGAADGEYHHPLSRSTASLVLNGEDGDLATATTATAPPAKHHLPQPQPEPPLHTRFLPQDQPIRDRYFWLLHGLAPRGTLYIDKGAHAALAEKAGLLPVGVLDVEGHFAQHEAVRLVVVERRKKKTTSADDADDDSPLWEGVPQEVGRALVNFAAPEIARIKGQRSSQIGALLGYADTEYVADRENITLFRGGGGGGGHSSSRESRPASPSLALESGGVAGYEVGSRG